MHSQKVDFQVRYTCFKLTFHKNFNKNINTCQSYVIKLPFCSTSGKFTFLKFQLQYINGCKSLYHRFNQVIKWYQYEKIILVNDNRAKYSRLHLQLTLNLWTSSCNLSLSWRISLYSSPELWKWLTYRQNTKSFCYLIEKLIFFQDPILVKQKSSKCQMLNFHNQVHCMDFLKNWLNKNIFNIFTECLKDGGSTKSVISLAANNMARGSIFFLCSSSLNTSRTTATKSEVNDVNVQVQQRHLFIVK